MSLKQKNSLLLFSGGQDSAICLFYSLLHFQSIEFIGFDYGQRHAIELQTRKDFLAAFKDDFPEFGGKIGEDYVYDLGVLKDVGQTALTHESQIQFLENGLPNTFVPGRNLAFFTIAAAHGWRKGISHLVGGMCQTDYSGYPDCRDDALKSLQATLSLGLGENMVIHTPLMWLSKAESWQLLEGLAGKKAVEFTVEHTHSCYLGVRDKRHIWGYGCGQCPACDLRQKGYEEYLQS